MEDAESFLRVAGAVITLLTAALLARDAGRTLAGRLGAAFSLGVAAYMACSSPHFHELPGYAPPSPCYVFSATIRACACR